jgi:saccharopine dehydrogenase-like NADP-dependent oxidoreductase
MNVVVLGAGRVGSAIAADLAGTGELEVTVADLSERALGRHDAAGLRTMSVDLSDPEGLRAAVAGQDLAIGAVPGSMGFETLRRVLEAGIHVVDISFCAEDPYALDELARGRGCVALVDCGVAPGLSNLILGFLEGSLDSVERFECLVGGLPRVRTWPFEYRAPFSPSDVIEEYTRPARMRRDGLEMTLPALSEIESVDVPGIGTLEAFNTDGLRTLLRTSDARTMVEKTLRYPGHAELMRVFRDSGFFSTDVVPVGEGRVRPRDLTSRLLFDAWRYEEGEEDLTVMRVTVIGEREGREESHVIRLLDRYDAPTRTSSMARTTGYTCTAMVGLVAQGLYRTPGVAPPEVVARAPGCYDAVMAHLAERGIVLEHRVDGGQSGV